MEIVPLRAAMEGTSYRGPDAAAQFVGASLEAWDDLGYELEDLRESGDEVIASGRLWARGRMTGADVDDRVTLVFRFEGDRIAQARAETGLPE